MIGLSGVDIVVGASGVSAVIGAGYLVHRAYKSFRVWAAQVWDRAEQVFSKAVDNSATGHLVKYHLGPNGTTRPMHQRVCSIEEAQSTHNTAAAAMLMDVSKRLVAVERAQRTAASVAEDTEARHKETTNEDPLGP